MRWLRYALLMWFVVSLTTATYLTFQIWDVMSDNAIRETLIEVVPALLALIYIWRCPPRSRAHVVDPIDAEIKLQPPPMPGDDVMKAAERLKHVVSPPLSEVKHGTSLR